ncbi:hypothetical protein [Schlesneria sp. DSM 10557]|uniref:hypothetical protein n=1 Tax=Schlesneria sp. DSM 10557 TaxID=3044399 RepID=UPI0035A05C57
MIRFAIPLCLSRRRLRVATETIETIKIVGGVLTLTIGDDYSYLDRRALEVDLPGDHLPDLTGAAVALHLRSGDRQKCALVIPGTVVTPSGNTRTLRFEPTSAQTGLLKRTVEGQFAVVITTSTRTITPTESRGVLTVLNRLSF